MSTTTAVTTTSGRAAAVVPFDEEECWTRLRGAGIARLVVRNGYDLDLLPAVLAVQERVIEVRTPLAAEPGSPIRGARAALEIDGEDHGDLWSVVVRGRTRPEAAGPGVVLDPTSISGRRIVGAATFRGGRS